MQKAVIDRGGKSSAATWFMSNGVSVILSTALTPGGDLKDTLQKVVEKAASADGGKTKVIEVGGAPIKEGYSGPRLSSPPWWRWCTLRSAGPSATACQGSPGSPTSIRASW